MSLLGLERKEIRLKEVLARGDASNIEVIKALIDAIGEDNLKSALKSDDEFVRLGAWTIVVLGLLAHEDIREE